MRASRERNELSEQEVEEQRRLYLNRKLGPYENVQGEIEIPPLRDYSGLELRVDKKYIPTIGPKIESNIYQGLNF